MSAASEPLRFPLQLPTSSSVSLEQHNQSVLASLNSTERAAGNGSDRAAAAGSGGASHSGVSTGVRSGLNTATNRSAGFYEGDPSSFFFPILPYGFVDHVDISGWQVHVGAKGSGSISTVFDHETQCEVIEVQSRSANPLVAHVQSNVALVPVQRTGGPMGSTVNEFGGSMLRTPRGTHAIVEPVTVHGNTGINNAIETSISQRLRGVEFTSGAYQATNSNGVFSGFSTEVNTRGNQLALARNLSPTQLQQKRLVTNHGQAAQSSPPAPNSNFKETAAGSSTASLKSAPNLSEKASPKKADFSASSSHPTHTFLEFPHPSQFIGTTLPILNLQIKNLEKYFAFDVEFEDVLGKLFTLHITNSSTLVRMRMDRACLPLQLQPGWNKLSFDLSHYASQCFQTTYQQIHRIKIHATARVRRIFLSDIKYPDFALPSCLRIFSDSFYAAKREEEQELRNQAQREALDKLVDDSTAATARSGGEEEKQQQGQLQQHKVAAPTASKPSRLRAQLKAELDAARELEANLSGTNKTGIPTTATAVGGQSYEQQLIDSQESRILARHRETELSWAAFKKRASKKLGVPEQQLNLSKTDLYRLKQEEADLLQKSLPESEKNGAGREEAWSGSLRSTGSSYVAIGNMFTGLFTVIKEDPNPQVEIVRRPNFSK